MMRAAKLFGQMDIRLVEAELPQVAPHQCLVELSSVGICGSDVHYYAEGRIGESRPNCPHILGHEPVGKIVRESSAHPQLKKGTRVYIEPGITCGKCLYCLRGDENLCPTIQFLGSFPIQGAFCDYLAYSGTHLLPLPDSFSDDAGVLLEPLAIAIHCVDLAHIRLGDRVAILGCGGMGLCLLKVVQAMGVRDILVYDPIPSRLERAIELGAQAIADLESDQGAQVVIEATNRSLGPRIAVQIVRSGGVLVLLGIPEGDDYSFDAHIARRKGLTLKVVRRSRRTTHRAMELVQSYSVYPEEIISHHYELSDISHGFLDCVNCISGLSKGVVTFHDRSK